MKAVEVRIPGEGHFLDGDLSVPDAACGLIIFAHGSGSSRHSSRNKFVAAGLNDRGLATLLLDLLTREEERIDEQTGHLRFDIGFLASRLDEAIEWAGNDPETTDLPVGMFGASTGAAAALVAAAREGADVRAIVSRGGRPDLAIDSLAMVRASTLLIVGSLDTPVIEMNERALAHLPPGDHSLVIVEGATHLFPEPGTLEEVLRLAGDWFAQRLCESA